MVAILSLFMSFFAAAGDSPTWKSEQGKQDAVIWHADLDRIGAFGVGAETVVIAGRDSTHSIGRCAGVSKETGKILWNVTHNGLPQRVHDMACVITSTPCIDGDRAYYLSNRGELCCVGTADGKVVWTLDMPQAPGVYKKDPNDTLELAPSPIVVGDIVYCVTANGRDWGFRKVQAPDAPSFVAVDKLTGKVIWCSNAPGKNISDGQWSTPAAAAVDGKLEILFPGGDGALYAFDARSGEQLWKLDCRNPLDGDKRTHDDFIVAPPLVVGETAYVSTAFDWERSCPGRRLLAIDLGTHAVRWAVSPKGFTGTLGPMAFAKATLYAAGNQGLVVAVDADSGKELWTRQLELEIGIYAGICFHNEKLYLTTEDGDLMILSSSTGKTLDQCRLDAGGIGTPIVERNRIFAVSRSSAWLLRLPGE
jgi:outer membrane protein assembly factor BamB